MKKSVEILGLPIISITEGRELGVSKTLLIDAKNGVVAAITIEDEDWYRGVKLIPYESVIAIGEDAVTITHSENILKLEEAGDYERFLVENIRVIGTKAITKKGRIQGTVTEVFIGEGGKIEQCEITAADGSTSEVSAAQISIFGKQVTVVDIDDEKKNNFVTEPPAFEPADNEPAQEVWTPAETVDATEILDTPAETVDATEILDTPAETVDATEILDTPAETVDATEILDTPTETVDATEILDTPAETVDATEILDTPAETVDATEILETPEETVDATEILDTPAETVDAAEILDTPAETIDAAEILDTPVEEVETPPEESAPVEEVVTPEPAPAETVEAFTPAVEEKPPVVEAQPSTEDQKIAAMTKQAKDLQAALKRARDSQQAATAAKNGEPSINQRSQVETTVVERRRRALLGKHATKTITAESGTVVVEAGAEVTEEVLQRARLSNKFIELSMTVQ